MHLSRDGRFVRTDIWREGKYLDLWSVPHILSGISVGIGLPFLGFEFLSAFTIGFLLLVGYEMFEALAKIEETPMNRILDIVVGMASFTPTLFLAPSLSVSESVLVFSLVTGLDVTLSWFGWRESKKAEVLEQALRLKFEERKRKLVARRARIKEGFQRRRASFLKRRTKLRKGISEEGAEEVLGIQ